MRKRDGFTLVEILIAVSIVAILAGIVVPRFAHLSDDARPGIMATTVRQVREKIEYHAAIGGTPRDVSATWFTNHRLPDHVWTDRALLIDAVDGSLGQRAPADITFDPTGSSEVTAWYNRTNGAFCALVPDTGDGATNLTLFHLINGDELEVPGAPGNPGS